MTSFCKSLSFILVVAISNLVYAQDVRLATVKRVYIVPNGDEKETTQFEEKIPKILGWEVTNDKSKADTLLKKDIEKMAKTK